MTNNQHLRFFGLFTLIILLSACAKQVSLSEMINKKKHDEDGIYYVEFDRPQNAQKIKSELDERGYKIKDAYYFSGLEKKTDKYKFLWFYGKEYESLKVSRSVERRKDSLLSAQNFKAYQMALNEFPELNKSDSPKEGLKHLSAIEDFKQYHTKYGEANLAQTSAMAENYVSSARELLVFKNLYGTSDFVESKILQLIPTSNEKEAKILSENFPQSKHLNKVELNYLSKVSDINDFIFTKECEKHFGINGRFNFMDVKEVKKFSENLNQLLPSKPDGQRLSYALFDEHIQQKVLIRNKADEYATIDSYLDYTDSQAEWMGKNYRRNKEKRLVYELNHSKYEFEEFDVFYEEANQVFANWQWQNGFTYIPDAIVIESFKGAKRVAQDAKASNSKIDQILFEEVDNKVFQELENDFELDEYSFIRMYGMYKIQSKKQERLPFHIIFELNEKEKNYQIVELIMTNWGTEKTNFDGKNRRSSFYYDKKTSKLIRRGK